MYSINSIILNQLHLVILVIVIFLFDISLYFLFVLNPRIV